MASNKRRKQLAKSAQTPGAYLITGLIMWMISYILFLLATDSGSYVEWIGFIIALVWGGARIIQGFRQHFN